jgi:hypothetical protein
MTGADDHCTGFAADGSLTGLEPNQLLDRAFAAAGIHEETTRSKKSGDVSRQRVSQKTVKKHPGHYAAVSRFL